MENKEIKIAINAYDILKIEDTLEHPILSKQIILDDISRNSTCYLVYYIDKIPVGYLAYSNCIDHIDILSIAVKPKHRRSGIAKLLFKHLENKNTESLPYFLEVRASNISAINLYESLNFKNISSRKNYYKDPIEDALIYIKN